jgi:hypothetical protein
MCHGWVRGPVSVMGNVLRMGAGGTGWNGSEYNAMRWDAMVCYSPCVYVCHVTCEVHSVNLRS